MRAATKKRLNHRQRKIAKLIETRGSMAQFVRELSKVSGKAIAWTIVYAWVLRGQIPKAMVLPVHKLTGVRLEDLLR